MNFRNAFNLFTSENESSCIDTFLRRNTNAFDFTIGLKEAIGGNSNHSWFIS
ncbi:MAG: DUF3871 family protein [Bacteroidota bacterium]